MNGKDVDFGGYRKKRARTLDVGGEEAQRELMGDGDFADEGHNVYSELDALSREVEKVKAERDEALAENKRLEDELAKARRVIEEFSRLKGGDVNIDDVVESLGAIGLKEALDPGFFAQEDGPEDTLDDVFAGVDDGQSLTIKVGRESCG